VDLAGNIYVADWNYYHQVKKFASDGTFLAQWGSECCQGAGAQYPGQFEHPFGIAVDGTGNVYVSDNDRFLIQKFTSDGAYLTQWGSLAQTPYPYGLTTDASGSVYVVGSSYVQKATGDGTVLAEWGSYGSGPGQLMSPVGVAVDAAGNVYVTDPYTSRIEKFGFLPTPTKPMSWGHLKQHYR
jgi:hypothetical protein